MNAGVSGLCGGASKGDICRAETNGDIGVIGVNTFDDHLTGDGKGVGVLGRVRIQNGVGVKGENVALTGPAIGVVGESCVGMGVQGLSHGAGAFGTGVHGVGGATGWGVHGETTGGVGGVFNVGSDIHTDDAPPGRAGVFKSTGAAQIRLVREFPVQTPPTSTQQIDFVETIITAGQETAFPADGQPGDLLCTTLLVQPAAGGEFEIATLWFCQQGRLDQATPAQWRQVLLGPPFFGQG